MYDFFKDTWDQALLFSPSLSLSRKDNDLADLTAQCPVPSSLVAFGRQTIICVEDTISLRFTAGGDSDKVQDHSGEHSSRGLSKVQNSKAT